MWHYQQQESDENVSQIPAPSTYNGAGSPLEEQVVSEVHGYADADRSGQAAA